MLEIKYTKKTIRGSMANQLLKIAKNIPSINKHQAVHFGRLYTTQITDGFRFPKGIDHEWVEYLTAKMEWIYPKGQKGSNVILQLHGGAYISGYSDTYRRSALKYIAISCSTSVLSLDYRLAPKHPFPAALEDALAAYDFLIKQGYDESRIIVAGDSAGGGLALALGLYLRDHHRKLPISIITMSAWTDLSMQGESHVKNLSFDPLLGEHTAPLDVDAYVGNNDVQNPYISPVYGEYHDFTNVMMHVGSYEVLESDTIRVAKKINEAGNKVHVTIYNGMFHVFQLAFGIIPDAKKAWKEIGNYIDTLFSCDLTDKRGKEYGKR